MVRLLKVGAYLSEQTVIQENDRGGLASLSFWKHWSNGVTHPGTQREASSVPETESSHLAKISSKTSLALAMSCCTTIQSSTLSGKGRVLLSSTLRMSKPMYLRWTPQSWSVWDGTAAVDAVAGGGGY